MKKIAINPSNKRYYSAEYIKGWEDGVKAQYEATIDAVHNDSCDGCKYIGVIEKCEQCRRIYAEFDDLYDKGGDTE